MAVQKSLQAAQGDQPGGLFLPLAFGQVTNQFHQVLPESLFHKEGLRVLGQDTHRAGSLQLPPVGLVQPSQQGQAGGLAGAVSTQQGQKLSPLHLQGQALHHIGTLLVILKPQFLPSEDWFFGIAIAPFRGQFPQRIGLGKGGQPVPPLSDGDRAGQVVLHRRPHPHGRGHGQEHAVALLPQGGPHFLGRALAQELALVQDGHGACQRESLLQPVLRQDNGGPQFPVDLSQHRQKVRGGNGVQLAGGLVQDEDGRLKDHHSRQVQQLLLSAGQIGDLLIKPGLDAEEGGHLRHPAADGGGVVPQALQAEGQLVPNLVGDDLVLRVLLDKTDPLALGPVVHFFQKGPVKENLTRLDPVGGQDGFQLPQEGRLAAAGGAAENQKISGQDLQIQAVQRLGLFLRVREGEVPNPEQGSYSFCRCFHVRSSFLFNSTGVRHRAR